MFKLQIIVENYAWIPCRQSRVGIACTKLVDNAEDVDVQKNTTDKHNFRYLLLL